MKMMLFYVRSNIRKFVFLCERLLPIGIAHFAQFKKSGLIIVVITSLLVNNWYMSDLHVYMLSAILSFMSLFYILGAAFYYKQHLIKLIYSHFIIQGFLGYYFIICHKDLVWLLWAKQLPGFSVLTFILLIVIFYSLVVMYNMGVFEKYYDTIKIYCILFTCTLYMVFYSMLCIFLILVICYFITDLQFFICIMYCLYFFVTYKILTLNKTLITLIQYMSWNYLIYASLYMIVSATIAFNILTFLILYLFSLFILLFFSMRRYQNIGLHNISTLKFIDSFYYFLLIFIQLVAIYYLGSNRLAFFHLQNTSALIVVSQLVLAGCHLKLLFNFILINNSSFVLSFPKSSRIVRMPILLLFCNCFLVIVLLYIFIEYFTTETFILDNFEYGTTQKVPRRVRVFTPSQLKRLKIAGLFAGDWSNENFTRRNDVTYEESLEAFRQQLERYGPLYGKKRRQRYSIAKMVTVGDYIGGFRAAAIRRMSRFANAYLSRKMIIRSAVRQGYLDVKSLLPQDLVRPMFDLYLIPQTLYSESMSMSTYVKNIMLEWYSYRTVHTRSFFTGWAPHKSSLHGWRDLGTVNLYFQMFYELHWARKLDISLELCKLLVDIYEVADLKKRANVDFGQYMTIIGEMYKDYNNEVDITLLVDPTWWNEMRSQPWWSWCQSKPLSVSPGLIARCWEQVNYPTKDFEIMYHEINFSMIHYRNTRKSLFNYPFYFNKIIQRWVPRTFSIENVGKVKSSTKKSIFSFGFW